jgi:hypothetical protein
MERPYPTVRLIAFGIFMGVLVASPLAGQKAKHGGKLILFGDIAEFQAPPSPDNCIVKNRFKRGEPVGFRLYAVDGATNQPETSAQVVVHITLGGKTYDVPALYRGVPHTNDSGGAMPIKANQWTAKWKVPDDAPTGSVRYSATARDKYGRTTAWTPQGGAPSLLTIVE